MKKRETVIRMGVLLIVGVLLVIAKKNELQEMNREEIPVPIEVLQTKDGIFQYDTYTWGSELEKVISQIPYQMKEVNIGTADMTGGTGYRFYTADDNFSLDGQRAVFRMEFVDEQLSEVRFEFQLTGDSEMWFERQAEKLVKQYGKETVRQETTDSGKIGVNSAGYRWDAEGTTLQFTMITGKGMEPTAVLGLATFQF